MVDSVISLVIRNKTVNKYYIDNHSKKNRVIMPNGATVVVQIHI